VARAIWSCDHCVFRFEQHLAIRASEQGAERLVATLARAPGERDSGPEMLEIRIGHVSRISSRQPHIRSAKFEMSEGAKSCSSPADRASSSRVTGGSSAQDGQVAKAGADLSLPAASYAEPHRNTAFVEQLVARLGGLPDVRAAAVSTGLPFGGVTDVGIRLDRAIDRGGTLSGTTANHYAVSRPTISG
jgi:hypothetical protein